MRTLFDLPPASRRCSNSRCLCTRSLRNNFAHTSHTQVDTPSHRMPKRVAYFDSQTSAAATLNIDIYELRDAKAAGCPAFRSGRVYRDELLRWLKEYRASRKTYDQVDLDEPEFIGVHLDWENRQSLLLVLNKFLDFLFVDGVLSPSEYRKLGDKTIPLIIKIGRIWNAEIDEAAYRARWKQCREEARQKMLQLANRSIRSSEKTSAGSGTAEKEKQLWK